MKKIICMAFFSLILISQGCSPLKSSPKEEKHQMELTLHEVQTNLDDLRHDLNCFQTEMQIIDGKIKHQEKSLTSLKSQYIEQQRLKTEALEKQLKNIDAFLSSFQDKQSLTEKDLRQLSSHANETASALSQYKNRIAELEKEIIKHKRHFQEVSKLKNTLESVAKTIRQATGATNQYFTYKVKSGDSLERIAKIHKTTVDAIKNINHLDHDLIVVGQELKIPN